MEEQNFADFDSNKADVGSSSRSSRSPPNSGSRDSASDGQDTQVIVSTNQHEGYQEAHYSTVAPLPRTHRPYSAPPSSYQAPYSAALVTSSHPTTSTSYLQALQPYTTTTQPEATYPSYIQSYTNASQPESVYNYTSISYPDPPPPAVPAPPPPPSYYPSYYPSQYDHRNHLPYPQANQFPQNTPAVSRPQSFQLQPIVTNFPHTSVLNTQQHQPEDADPWSPLSSRKRRASETLSSAVLGVSDAAVNWGYNDKLGEELEQMQSRGIEDGHREEDEYEDVYGAERDSESESGRLSGEGQRKRRKRGRRGNGGDRGNGGSGNGGRRGGRRDDDEGEDEGAMNMGMAIGRGRENSYGFSR